MFSLWRTRYILIFSSFTLFGFFLIHKSQKPRIKNNLKEITGCFDRNLVFSLRYRGEFIILNNFVKASSYFRCEESITLTTQGDFRFLDNLVPLLEVWRGPVSVAIYAPGDDFYSTLDSIAFLRNCHEKKKFVRDFASFHIFFEAENMPEITNKSLVAAYSDYFDCRESPPFSNLDAENSYRARKKLFYPINLARNVARENTQTHFVFPSDIELSPSPNFINKFFKMVEESPEIVKNNKRVFVLPVFEIEENETIPKNKTALQALFHKKRAIFFHQEICKSCHLVLKSGEWIKARETNGLSVFTVGKRQKRHIFWEPFYVGTNAEPFFDERLTWEGQGNKMTQAYSLCLLDYDFAVLDNAFLVHKPGIKKKSVQLQKHAEAVNKTKTVLRIIRNELTSLLGDKPACQIIYGL